MFGNLLYLSANEITWPCSLLCTVNNWRRRAWWRHQFETFSALLTLCTGNSPVTGAFPPQKPMTQRFDVFFDRRLNKLFSKQSRSRWFENPSRSLWRHCNDYVCVHEKTGHVTMSITNGNVLNNIFNLDYFNVRYIPDSLRSGAQIFIGLY